MKKFRQYFQIAIITPSDGFTQISINFANQVSIQKTAPSWQAYRMRETTRAQKTVWSF